MGNEEAALYPFLSLLSLSPLSLSLSLSPLSLSLPSLFRHSRRLSAHIPSFVRPALRERRRLLEPKKPRSKGRGSRNENIIIH